MSDTDGVEPIKYKLTITCEATRQGTKMHVDVEPNDLFADTIVELCHRAARFFDKRAHIMEHIQQVESFSRQKEELRRKGLIIP